MLALCNHRVLLILTVGAVLPDFPKDEKGIMPKENASTKLKLDWVTGMT